MSFFSPALIEEAEYLIKLLRSKKMKLACAESCTGGLLSALMTEISGSSDVFTHGFITYANEAKSQLLNIPAPLIQVHGAVSEEVATAMAVGALRASGAGIAVSITGIAGPGGGTVTKPVGRVHIAVAQAHHTTHQQYQFSGDRSAVRLQAVAAAIEMLQTFK